MAETLLHEDLVLAAARTHALARRREVTVAALREVPLILLPETYCTRRLVEHAFQSAEVRPRVAIEMNSIESILRTVASTGGATVVPGLALRAVRGHGLCRVRLTRPTTRRAVGLLWLAGAHRSAAATRFAQFASNAVARQKAAP